MTVSNQTDRSSYPRWACGRLAWCKASARDAANHHNVRGEGAVTDKDHICRSDQHTMREIVLDTERTGLDSLGGDRVVEIGAAELTSRSFRAGLVAVDLVLRNRSANDGIGIEAHS
jgi:DNA polymerase III epsilon subunit-like protein